MAAAPAAAGGFSNFMGGAMGQAAIQGGISIGGNLFSAREGKKAYKRQQKLIQSQRDWDERMSNTSWQRGVTDMLAAGINPMVAFNQGGASTPNTEAGTANVIPEWSGALNSAAKAAGLLALKQQEANINLTNANAYKAQQEGTSAAAQARYAGDNAMFDSMIKGEQWTNLKRQYDLTDAQAKQIEAMLPALLASETARAKLTEQQTSSAKTQQRLDELKIPEAETTARWFESVMGGGGRAANMLKDMLQIWQQIRGRQR